MTTYQHIQDGEEIDGATSASLVIDPVGGETNGSFTILVTNETSGRSRTIGPVVIDVQGGIGFMVIGTDFTVG